MLSLQFHIWAIPRGTFCSAFALVFLVAALPARSQVVTLTGESIDETFNLTGQTWRFSAGDNPAWADPGFDDSDWMITPSLVSLGPDSIANEWDGIGWFRLQIRLDSTATDELLLSISQSGASDIFINGELATSIGAVSANREGYDYELVTAYPVPWKTGPDSVATIAIRFANHDLPRWFGTRVFTWHLGSAPVSHLGAGVSLHTFDHHTAQVREASRTRSFDAAFAGLLAGLSVLGLLIYLLQHSDRAILFLTLHIAFMAATFAMLAGPTVASSSFLLTAVAIACINPLLIVALAFMVIGVARAFFPERRYVHAWVWTLAGFAVAPHIAFSEYLGWTSLVGILLLMLDALQMVVRAAWRRKAGGIALGAGVLTMVGILVASSIVLEDIPRYLTVVALSAFPVSIIVLIAQRYSRTTRELGEQLVRVEKLSEEKLEAEREKQRLIQRQNEELNERVEERTTELSAALDHLKSTQEQLVEQEKLASLGSLTAGIAHEIKNPLNFVNNFAEVSSELAVELRDAVESGDAEAARAIVADLLQNTDQIAKHGKRADSIVRSMMQHARGGTAAKETVDVNDFVSEYVDLAWHGMRARDDGFKADVEKDLDPAAGTMTVQSQEIGRVLVNLLNNAFQVLSSADGPEKGLVRVTTRRKGAIVEIVVADNGPGIPVENRSRIFEPFFTTKATGEGTGLGLSLSYDIVTKGHGGEMIVDDAPGGGARFTVRIPAGPAVADGLKSG